MSALEETILRWQQFADSHVATHQFELSRSRRPWRGIGKQTWLFTATVGESYFSAIHDTYPEIAINRVLDWCEKQEVKNERQRTQREPGR